MIGLDPDTKVAINTGDGLIQLFSSRNLTITDYSKYTDDTNDVVKDTFNATTFTNNVIQPGDILASYRHHSTLSKKTIYNITNNEEKTVYAYDNFNEEEIDGQAIFGMLLYRDNTTVYIYDSFLGIVPISLTNDYNNTKYQEDDKYQKLYHGTHPNSAVAYDNDKESGYYTLNAEKKVEESVYDASGTYAYYYFKYDGSNTSYINEGGRYFVKSSFESAWTDYMNKAKKYDEYMDNKDAWTAYNNAYDAWEENQAAWSKYNKYQTYLSELAEYEAQKAAHDAWKVADPETRGPEPSVRSKPATVAYAAQPSVTLVKPTAPSKTSTEPTKPAGYVRNSSSTESVARSYVANNYSSFSLARFYIRTEGTARYLANYSTDARVSAYEKYYNYIAGREYYKFDASGNKLLATAYGTGWDGLKNNNNYWLIYADGTRIYSRWRTFF